MKGRREACFSHWAVLVREVTRLGFRGEDLALKRREIQLEEENARLKAQLKVSHSINPSIFVVHTLLH